MAHFEASSPRTPAPRPHPPRLQHSPSLPNLWLPPRDGPIPPHVSRSPTASHSSTSDLPRFGPLDLPSSLKPTTRQSSRLSNDLSRKSHKSHYLTPPLTPSSSLKSDSTDPEASDSHEKIDAQKDKVATKVDLAQVSQSRFLILRNVPQDVPEDVLRTLFSVIASSCDTTEYASEGEANLLRNQPTSIANNSGADQVIHNFNFSYRDKCTVILELYDYRKAKRMKSLIEERRNISAVEGKGKDKQKAGTKNNHDSWDEDIHCAFLAPREFAELIDKSGSSFKPLYDSDFLLSVGEAEAASGRGRTDGFAVEKHLPSLTRVKSILSTHGDLCLFRFIRGDDHQQLFLIDYYDIRATQSAWNDLDNRVIDNVKFSMINRGRFGEDSAKDLDCEAKKSLEERHSRDESPAEAKTPAAARYAAPGTTSTNKDTNHVHSAADVPEGLDFHAEIEYQQAAVVRSRKGTTNTGNRRNIDDKDTASSSVFRGLESTSQVPSALRRPSVPDTAPRMAYPGGPSVTSRRSSSFHYPDAMQRGPVDGRQGGYFHPHNMRLPSNNEYHASFEDHSQIGGVEAPEVSPVTEPYHATASYYYERHPSTAMEAPQREGVWYYGPDASSAQAHHHPAIVNFPLVPSPGGAQMYWDPWASWMHPDAMSNHGEEWGPSLIQPTHHHGYPQQPMYNYPYHVPPQHPTPVYPPPPHSVPYFVQPPRAEPHSRHPPASSSAVSERNQLDIRRLENGSDTRTTVMVKNIPNKMTDKELIAYIDKVCHRRIDFLYLRMDFQNGCNVGYAFVNFITVQDLELFAKSRLGKKWNMYSSEKVLHMSYANYQGKEALVEKFKNSCIMDEIEDWRPKIFYSSGPNQGLPEPFPKPTHIRRKERSSYNRGALFVPGIHSSSSHRKAYLNSNSPQQRALSQHPQTDGGRRRRDSYERNDYYDTEREDDDGEGRSR